MANGAQNKAALLAVLAVGGILLVGATRKNGSGNGGGADPDGPIHILGSIASIEISQTILSFQQQIAGLELGAHRANKIFGTTFSSRALNRVSAKDAVGNDKRWPFRWIAQMGHNTRFGWKRPVELGFPEEIGFRSFIGWATGDSETIFSSIWTVPSDPNQTWDIRVEVFGAVSDENGEPARELVGGLSSFVWRKLAEADHAQAIASQPRDVITSGSIVSVDIS